MGALLGSCGFHYVGSAVLLWEQFTVALAALAIGTVVAMPLGLIGLLFFAHINLRYGAPYLLDYVMPVF